MNQDVKRRLIRIITAGVLLITAVVICRVFSLSLTVQLLLYLPSYLLAGYDVLWDAIKGIGEGEFMNEDFLMSVATIGALLLGFLPNTEPEFPEAVFVMLFFQVGELFEDIAEGRSERSISALMDIRPDSAQVERGGRIITVDPNEIAIGEIIIIKPGDKAAIDGEVIEGDSSLNTVAITGESVPRSIHKGDKISSGCVNLTGVLRVRTTKLFGESTASKILDLVKHASEHKSKSENFITKFARYYTPIVVFFALAIAVLPPLFSGDFISYFADWLGRALTFLVVSCPCAFVISVPLTFFGGIGGASGKGILIKGSNFMEALGRADTVVFDKTGTLTQGVFEVTAVHPNECDENLLLHYAAHVERFSTHPIGNSLRAAYAREADECKVEDIKEIAGEGICGKINEKEVCVGNTKLMEKIGAGWKKCTHNGTIIHVAIDGVYAGHIVISDKIREDSKEAIADLKKCGIKKTVMLTGDRRETGKYVADELGIDAYHAELMPEDKVNCVSDMIKEEPSNGTVIFVGDGINDAPVLARADVGIAMGAMGSDAAIEAADVVLMNDKPTGVVSAIRVARRTMGIAKENIAFALIVKIAVLLLATLGFANLMPAVFADVGVTCLAVLNAMRALKLPEKIK